MTTLVIGGSGYLGSAITRACARSGRTTAGLSRSGRGTADENMRGDVRLPGLGLCAADASTVAGEVTEVVTCFGSVAWDSSPSEAIALHSTAVRNVLGYLGTLPHLRRVVHVSSLLALGQADGVVGNRELYVGQRFRNWYEYGKYCAERHVRDAELPVNVVRFGPLLGAGPHGERVDVRAGLPAVFPHLLAGCPVHLARRGEFPCYVADVGTAAEIVLRALDVADHGRTWSWFDPVMPTLADVFREVCRPWGVVPRILDVPALGGLTRLIGGRIGLLPELPDYARPWFDVPRAVLDEIPGPLPEGDPDYLAATGRAMRDAGTVLGVSRG